MRFHSELAGGNYKRRRSCSGFRRYAPLEKTQKNFLKLKKDFHLCKKKKRIIRFATRLFWQIFRSKERHGLFSSPMLPVWKERREIGPGFPRETAFSQASSMRLLVDCSMMTSFLGSARSSTLRPIQSKWKLSPCLKKMSQKLRRSSLSWSGTLSFSLSTEIPIYRERSRSMNHA